MERRVVVLALGVAAVVAATTLRGARLLPTPDVVPLDPIGTFLEENLPELADALVSSSSLVVADTVGLAASLGEATSAASSTDGDVNDLMKTLQGTTMDGIDDENNNDAYEIIQKTLLCDRRLGNCTQFILMYTTNGTEDDGATVVP
ncbi:hypothetical protein SDRG_11697 [Saprolegnia diclina VS20]|uniref:Uncharacterized protein n=1 Tax=Saprolegnia diclina (strain VS20) TaxID=1156394 RepID=T0RL32_SAPDV|nr:hypothetical protein SDRG_11697 [Saprolegnia diclina VS20]EQC30642.1 hypothetical protein SDRG_11697 [Saprolegnia diclina VS20]|eukprot:XP_008615968.1 hypothetical protein SDRG_11697 [Saprolegnia diclina VS20]